MRYFSKKSLIILPAAVFLSLGALEFGLWVFRPWAWFHPRGFNAANLYYQSTIYGDYINNATDVDPMTGDFLATPIMRQATIITDSYGERNDRSPHTAFAVMMGDSMANGDGNSHKDIPTQQLSRMIKKRVILPFKPRGYDRFGAAALYLRHRKPTKAATFIFLLHDQWFREPLASVAPIDQIDRAYLRDDFNNLDPSWQANFQNFKAELRAWSGNAILARKTKTTIKRTIIQAVSKMGIYHHKTNLVYLPNRGKKIIFEQLPEDIVDITHGHAKFDRLFSGTKKLAAIAQREGVNFLVVLIPAKEYPYNQFRSSPVWIENYGPASKFNRALVNAGINTVFSHPVLFDAVKREIEDGAPPVYWGDDGHWGPYGIRITMELIRDKLISLRILEH